MRFLLLSLLLLPALAPAQSSDSWLFLTGYSGLNSWTTEGSSSESGFGIGGRIGIGSSTVALIADGNVSRLSTAGGNTSSAYNFWQGLLGVQVTFGSRQGPVRPYIDGGVLGVRAAFQEPTEITFLGWGGAGSAGVLYFITPKIAVNARGTYTRGQIVAFQVGDRREWTNETDFSGFQAQIGLTLYP
ncbi:MAG: outer membrane beta-barrel protein [Bacteroidota bacterium]